MLTELFHQTTICKLVINYMKKPQINSPYNKLGTDGENLLTNQHGPDVPTLSQSEILALHEKIGYVHADASPLDLAKRLNEWAAKLKPDDASFFNESIIDGARALNELIAGGHYRHLTDENGTPLTADQTYNRVGMHNRRFASKFLLAERAFTRLPLGLKARIKKRGTIEPLHPLLKKTAVFTKACEQLQKHPGKITGDTVAAAAREAKGVLMQSPEEFEESEKKRFDLQNENNIKRLIQKLLGALAGLPTASRIVREDLPEAIEFDRTKRHLDLNAPPAAHNPAKDAPPTNQEKPADVPANTVAESATIEADQQKSLLASSALSLTTAAESTAELKQPNEQPAAVPAASAPAVKIDSGPCEQKSPAILAPCPSGGEPPSNPKATSDLLTWDFLKGDKTATALAVITELELRIVIDGSQGRVKKAVLYKFREAGFQKKEGQAVWVKQRETLSYEAATNYLNKVMPTILQTAA